MCMKFQNFWCIIGPTKSNPYVKEVGLGKASKKKSQTWDIVPTGGEGVRHLELSVPTSLSILKPKIKDTVHSRCKLLTL